MNPAASYYGCPIRSWIIWVRIKKKKSTLKTLRIVNAQDIELGKSLTDTKTNE